MAHLQHRGQRAVIRVVHHRPTQSPHRPAPANRPYRQAWPTCLLEGASSGAPDNGAVRAPYATTDSPPPVPPPPASGLHRDVRDQHGTPQTGDAPKDERPATVASRSLNRPNRTPLARPATETSAARSGCADVSAFATYAPSCRRSRRAEQRRRGCIRHRCRDRPRPSWHCRHPDRRVPGVKIRPWRRTSRPAKPRSTLEGAVRAQN